MSHAEVRHPLSQLFTAVRAVCDLSRGLSGGSSARSADLDRVFHGLLLYLSRLLLFHAVSELSTATSRLSAFA